MATLTYEPDKGIEFCERLSTSEFGMETVCRELGLVPRTVWRWLSKVPEFWDMYTKARDFQTELMYDEISRIAYLPLTHNGEAVEDGGCLLDAGMAMAVIQQRKLIIDALKFKLAKLQPKRFGDNRNVQLDVAMPKQVTTEQYEQLRAALVQKQIAPAQDIEHEDIND